MAKFEIFHGFRSLENVRNLLVMVNKICIKLQVLCANFTSLNPSLHLNIASDKILQKNLKVQFSKESHDLVLLSCFLCHLGRRLHKTIDKKAQAKVIVMITSNKEINLPSHHCSSNNFYRSRQPFGDVVRKIEIIVSSGGETLEDDWVVQTHRGQVTLLITTVTVKLPLIS